MKRKFCLFLIGLFLLGALMGNQVAVAEEIERPKSVLSTDVYALTTGMINAKYEKVLKPDLSYTLGAGIDSTFGVSAFLGTIGIRKYLKPTAPEGFWFEGSGGIVTVSVLGISVIVYTVTGGLGYKWFLGEKFVMEPYAGYTVASIAGYSTGVFNWGFSVGFAF